MRLPLSTDLITRAGVPDKDARLTNCFVEVKGNDSIVVKRPGILFYADISTGTAQGAIRVGNAVFIAAGDVISTISATSISGNAIAGIAVSGTN